MTPERLAELRDLADRTSLSRLNTFELIAALVEEQEVATTRLSLLSYRSEAEARRDRWVAVLERELAVYTDVDKLRRRLDQPSDLRQMFAAPDGKANR